MRSSLPLALCIVLLYGSAIKADVWRFLPGDSFFRSSLTHALATTLRQLGDDESLALRYDAPPPATYVRGFSTLEIDGMPRRQRHNLVRLYEQVRRSTPPIFEITTGDNGEVRRELNGMALFVYNASFDCTEHRIGFRYNEDWADDGRSFGVLRPYVNYPYIDTQTASNVIEDWHGSKLVPPLNATIPTVQGKSRQELQFVPVKTKCADIQLIIVESDQVEDLRARSQDARQFYILRNAMVTRFAYIDSHWEPTDITFDE
ncbi:MAG: hypothetical protein JSS49_20430 [Planctomycetes bacterium]|nr:hypothetical protein [Planctomycetota bacterium]